ncbi:MAG TPA: iron ABC transporter permease [Azospirillaceae bacterium]|nr:iron ABC transporter permease [Azospirillaceae bacterium]
MTVQADAPASAPSAAPSAASSPGPSASRLRGVPLPDPLTVAVLVVAALVALPVLVVGSNVLRSSDGVWAHLAATVLSRYVVNTAVLALGVGLGTFVVGVGTAWLVTMCRFPGRRAMEWALLLPMAVPAYVMAYAYTDLLQFPGPLQSWIRAATGWSRRDYWFPEIRSMGGAVAMLTLVLYPYVYLLARAAFLEQSVCVLEVSRTLGRGPWSTFARVALPLARPAVVAGLALVTMETLAEFGTVQYFAVDTFTTGIYRTWFGMGSPTAAAQLAASLMLFVLVVLVLERATRGQARFHHTTGRYRTLPRYPLRGGRAAVALVACLLPLVLGFLLPVGILARLAWREGDRLFGALFAELAWHSFALGAMAAGVAVAVALLLAYGRRLRPTPLVGAAVRVAGMGYAIPGAVIAVGVLLPFAWIDNAVDGWARATLGVSTGLLLTGTVAAVLFAYLVRFLAVSYNTVEASLGKISPSIDRAAHVFGRSPGQAMARIHGPLMLSSLFTAALLVFVDVLKELPATMIIRPFNFETLAVRVYRLASDERLAEAATPALAIVAVGIIPVVLLSRAIARSRPGGPVD